MKRIAIFAVSLLCICASCTRVPEMSEEEIDTAIEAINGEMLRTRDRNRGRALPMFRERRAVRGTIRL